MWYGEGDVYPDLTPTLCRQRGCFQYCCGCISKFTIRIAEEKLAKLNSPTPNQPTKSLSKFCTLIHVLQVANASGAWKAISKSITKSLFN
uniref:Uncharacterized protein n=1 Tax=Solanum tuberosum TaxID=4113 RepID=M0ZZ57_SOLTU